MLEFQRTINERNKRHRKITLNANTKATLKGKNATYQTILYKNTQLLANFVNGKSKFLSFDVFSLATRRNDSLDIQQCILAITLTERRMLGIGQSGLWYPKGKLAEGKTIKVYNKMRSKLT